MHESGALDERPMECAASIAVVRATAAGTVEEIKHTVVSFKKVVLPIVSCRVEDENGIGTEDGL